MNLHDEIPYHMRMKGYFIFLLRHIFYRNPFLEEIQNDHAKEVSSFLSFRKSPHYSLEVPKIKDLTEEEFVKNYLNKNIPVIFDGAAKDWKSTTEWNFQRLASTYGEQEFSIVKLKGLGEKDQGQGLQKLSKVKLSDYIKDIESSSTQEYLRFLPFIEVNPDLEKDFDLRWLKTMRKCFFGVSYQSFIGPKGKKTPMHSDTTAFFYIMSEGVKKWTLLSPAALSVINPEPEGRGYNFTNLDFSNLDIEKYPGANIITKYECYLKEGDILFVPSWMWHEAENLTNSIGTSYRFTSIRSFLSFPSYALLRMFFTRPSFITVLYYSFFKTDLHKRDKLLVTPKIFLKK